MIERLDLFMARANAAYYAARDPFADFTTAPEISQAFGEVLGAWAAVCWDQMGRPVPVLLAEAGPGRGTLMADALRAIGQVAPDFAAAARVHLIESSTRLRAEQARRTPVATWHDTLADIPPGPMILFANEFLDALPIRQFVRRGAGWTERHVDGGAFVEIPATGPDAVAAEGEVIEIGEAAAAWVGALATRLCAQGGVALLVDYGPLRGAPGESLQALRDGRPADPLEHPGRSDLTAHVNFAAISRRAQAAGAAVHGPLAQGALLERLGLPQRARDLARARPFSDARAIMDSAQRLTAPEYMGALFKALAICHPAFPAPPGF